MFDFSQITNSSKINITSELSVTRKINFNMDNTTKILSDEEIIAYYSPI